MKPVSLAENVVQQQLDAYNAHDIDALMACYADAVQLFEHPATLLTSGTAQTRQRMAARLAEPNLHARLLNRMVLGNTVIDHELVTRTFPEGPGTLEILATYQVVGNKIARAWFIYGEKMVGKSA